MLLTSAETLARFVAVSSGSKERRCLRVTEIEDTLYNSDFAPSEAVSFRMQPTDMVERVFLRDERGFQHDERPVSTALYELTAEKMRRDEFIDLAEAALNDAIARVGPNQIDFSFDVESAHWPVEMEFPEMAATATLLLSDGRKRRVMITAEAPSVNAVRNLEQDDIYVVRYTDRTTLKRLIAITDEYVPRRPLPQELAALRPNPRQGSQGIFRRAERATGAVVLGTEWQRWQQEFPHHPLCSRGLTVVPTGIRNIDHGNSLVFVPSFDTEAFPAEVPSDVGLRELLKLQNSALGLRLVLDDDGFRSIGKEVDRWAIRNNRRPIVPRRLPSGYIVPEGWLVFSGDYNAAAVVASDIFEIWMKGHIASGDAVGAAGNQLKICDAFPWPDGFSTAGYVTCSNPPLYFTELVKELVLRDLDAEYAEPSSAELRREINPGHRYELGQSLLASYGLQRNSSEAEILCRLKFLSDNGDARADIS